MFKRKTVFIVGAGGSKEVHFPVGGELKYTIAGKVNFSFADGFNLSSGDRKIYSAIRSREQAGIRDFNPWWTAGRMISAAMPQASSIDNFLHTHSKKPEIVEVGKLAIAASILEAEKSSPLYIDTRRRADLDFQGLPTTWHTIFVEMLAEYADADNLDAIFDNVSFITFNYDRCIEHYVAEALRNYFLIHQEQAYELASKMRIFHPYGQVGRLPWPRNADGIPFGVDLHPPHLLNLATQIRTFTERIEDHAMLEAMKDTLAEAELVVCIGFAYAPMNLDLLSLMGSERSVGRVLGSCLGMSSPNQLAAADAVRLAFRTSNVQLVHLSGLQLLADYRADIMG
ncbi:hypothetical protein [Aureimonas leprariae]|uniref:SIR2-like domain-containing protein n=1 Tax=Plantimonas leprariae TaxID=2615207 RepID=A0A7V7TW85_9HYPH|nr:hypothetical protein [Aureimonas leprariae]KAB0679231.1 hypothetical protein F6X38_12870 [Aureimonas leprariae]